MANQKTYTIEIQGVKESYENVSKLADVLDKLTDKVVKVSSEMEDQTETVGKNTKQVHQNTMALDELGKATQKLEDFDAEYEKELQRVKQELSAQKKEVSELIKQEQAQAVVEAKQLNSYADKQKYLTSLNKLIRTHADVTEEDKQEIAAMVQESAKLQQELKDWDYNMKIYTRNVGNYPGQMGEVIEANRNLKQELRSLTDEMANMLANGVDKTDPKFQSLAQRAGQLKDAMADANDEIKHFASDTKSLDNVINLAQTATSVWGLYSNAMQLFGDENEEVAESMKKMMVVMSTLQQLQTLQNALTANGSATAKVYTTVTNALASALGLKTTATQADTTATTANAAATNAATVATNGATVATKALSVAMRAIPLMFVIGLVITLITEWENIWNWMKKTFPVLDTLSKKFDKFGGLLNTLKAALVGFGKAILNWVINPVQTLGKVLERLFALDFKGAYQALGDGIAQQFKGSVEAFKSGFQEQVEKGLEEISLKALKEGNKQTQQELAELKIRERNNKTYSDKYIQLQKKDFEERKKLAKGNQEELNKIKLEEMQFDADVEDKKTAKFQEEQKERTRIANEAAKERTKAEEEAAKERQKKIADLEKSIESNIKDANGVISESVAMTKKMLEDLLDESYKNFVDQYAKVTTDLEKNAKAREQLEKQSLYAAEEYLVKRKTLAVQTLLTEAEETKKQYQKIIDETKNLIVTTKQMIETASGEERQQLENQLKQLETTLEKTTKEMKVNLGEYAENPIVIPFDINVDDVSKKYLHFKSLLDLEGEEIGFNLTDVFQTLLGTGEQVTDKIFSYVLKLEDDLKNGLSTTTGEAKEAFDEVNKYITDMAVVGMLPSKTINQISESLRKLGEDVQTMDSVDFENHWRKVADNIRKAFLGANTDISELGQIAKNTTDDIAEMSEKMTDEVATETLKQVDKVFSYNEKVLKKFQEAAKGLKIEIVNVDDALTETFGGQIMSIDKTRERYEKIKDAYLEYQKALEQGKDEELWKKKLKATEDLYGSNSTEYKLLLDEKAKADAEYALEYEKVQEQLQLLEKKTNDIAADYAESLGKRIQYIYDVFSKNMFEPLAEGFTALLDYQIEEAERRLEDVEKLLDKAVELREDSEEKIEEINGKLRDSDKGNTEALKQQLADEMVLLVQRQQNERDLQKQKEKEEALIKKKEKQQRKIELGQKLIEGIVNTAVGVTAALRYGPILGPIFAAIIGAMGALQTGIIVKQISKLEKGGKLKGKSHAQGGIPVGNTGIEVEGGEFVVNKKSTIKYEPLIEAINNDDPIKVRTLAVRYENGGRLGGTTINNYYNSSSHLVSSSINRYASGGRLDYGRSVAAIERNRDAYRVSDAINSMNFEPVVAVRDIAQKTNDLVKVVDIAGGNLKR